MTADRAAAGAAFTLHWSGATDRGRFRPNNEDSFLGLQFDAREVHHLGKHGHGSLAQTDYAFAVSDGMGGALAGEYASRIAVDTITSLLPRSFQASAEGLAIGFDDILAELFDKVHRALVRLGHSYEECTGMETTLSLCWFTPGWMYFGHVGDSRIYLLSARTGTIKQLTHDDTHVGWLRRNGQLTEYQARTHPRRNVLQKSLGGRNQFVDPQVGAVGLESGDTFLLCSDGLIDGLFDQRLVELLQSRNGKSTPPFDGLGRELIQAALEGGSRDNTTALVVRVA